VKVTYNGSYSGSVTVKPPLTLPTGISSITVVGSATVTATG
jgi:hypothetical protein